MQNKICNDIYQIFKNQYGYSDAICGDFDKKLLIDTAHFHARDIIYVLHTVCSYYGISIYQLNNFDGDITINTMANIIKKSMANRGKNEDCTIR